MATIVVIPGSARVATVPIKVVPAGVSCSTGVILTSDAVGNNSVYQSSLKAFTSTGAWQNVTVSITVPAVGGLFYVWVPVTMSGISVGAFGQADSLMAQGVEVGTVTWT